MRSAAHALISLAIGLVFVLAVDIPGSPWLPLATAVAAGVLIDLDHFPIARLRSGSWAAVERCLERPTIVVVEQGAIFDEGTVGAANRLLSHHLIGGVLVGALLVVDTPYAILVGVTIYGHIVSDLFHDVRSGQAETE